MNKIKRTIDIINSNNTLKDITIIHLADIHFNINTKEDTLNKLKEEIHKNNPDYIIITGDLIDTPSIIKNNKINILLNFLSDIKNISKVIISLGNHDIITDKDYLFFKKINDIKNIYVLDNEKYQDEFIYIAGFTLPSNYYYNITRKESIEVLIEYLDNHKKLISNLPKELPKVALIHSPLNITDNYVLNKLQNYDLILSGHTHNGMVLDCFEKLFVGNSGLIAPNKNLFPKIVKGKIEKYLNNHLITIIINGGITKLSKSSAKTLSKLNFLYNMSINKIIIKKRGN